MVHRNDVARFGLGVAVMAVAIAVAIPIGAAIAVTVAIAVAFLPQPMVEHPLPEWIGGFAKALINI